MSQSAGAFKEMGEPHNQQLDRRPGPWTFAERWTQKIEAADKTEPTRFDYLLERSHKKDGFIGVAAFKPATGKIELVLLQVTGANENNLDLMAGLEDRELVPAGNHELEKFWQTLENNLDLKQKLQNTAGILAPGEFSYIQGSDQRVANLPSIVFIDGKPKAEALIAGIGTDGITGWKQQLNGELPLILAYRPEKKSLKALK